MASSIAGLEPIVMGLNEKWISPFSLLNGPIKGSEQGGGWAYQSGKCLSSKRKPTIFEQWWLTSDFHGFLSHCVSPGWWFQRFLCFHPHLRRGFILFNSFQLGWNHQPVFVCIYRIQPPMFKLKQSTIYYLLVLQVGYAYFVALHVMFNPNRYVDQ